MGLTYQSTRGGEKEVTASMAILQGLAKDGGLFMPSCIPQLDVPLEKLASMTYQETAYEVMKLFLTDYTEKELKDCIARAYDSKFDTEEIAPLAKADGAYYLELYHGSTIAFKDMALSILPHLMTTAARKNHVDREIVILTATSGDTGKAHGRICRCARHTDHCILSQGRSQQGPGASDAHPERGQHLCGGNPRQF